MVFCIQLCLEKKLVNLLKFLLQEMQTQQEKIPIKLIDQYGIDGDFVESQAFAYLAVRSYLKLPISFPATTGCLKVCTGGEIIKS